MILEKEISIYQPGAIGKEFDAVTDLADGKNSVFYQASPPAVEGRKEGDVWYDSDGDNAMYKFDGEQWVLVQFGTNAIVAGAVTTAKLDSQDVYTNFLLVNLLRAAQAEISELSAITADMGEITAGILKSTDYAYSSGKYSTSGMAVDLTAKAIRMTHTALVDGALYAENVDLTGKIVAKTGEIGGLEIDATSIHTKGVVVTDNSANSVALSSAGFSRDILKSDGTYITRNGLRFAIADKIAMDGAGNFFASAVNVAGTMVAHAGAVGGFEIDETSIHTKNVLVTDNSTNSVALSSVNFTRTIDGIERNGLRFAIANKFGVTNDGIAYVSNIIAKGTIYATGGSISGSLVTSGINADNITAGTLSAARIAAESIEAEKLKISTLSSINANIGTVKTGKLQTTDYAYSSGHYSSAGMLIDLSNKVIRAPKFAVEGGAIYAKDGTFMGDITAKTLEVYTKITLTDLSAAAKGHLESLDIGYSDTTAITGDTLWAMTVSDNVYVSGAVGVNGNLVKLGNDSTSTRKMYQVINSLGSGSFRVSNTGAMGIYSDSQEEWLIYTKPETVGKWAYIPMTLSVSSSIISDGIIRSRDSNGASVKGFTCQNTKGYYSINVDSSGDFVIYDQTNSKPIIKYYPSTAKLWDTGYVEINRVLMVAGPNVDNKGPRMAASCLYTDGQRINYFATGGNSTTASHQTWLNVNGQFEGSTSYKTISYASASSDIRLKTNVTRSEVSDALSLIRKIKMRAFDWKDMDHEGLTKEHQKIGFIADELEELDSRLAAGGGYDDDGSMNIKVVDTFYLLGYVVKALQEIDQKLTAIKKGE